MVSPIFHGKYESKFNVPQAESRVMNSSAGCRYTNLGLSCERSRLPSEVDTRHCLERSWSLEFIIYKLLGKTAACKNCWLHVSGIICYPVMEQHCWVWEDKKAVRNTECEEEMPLTWKSMKGVGKSKSCIVMLSSHLSRGQVNST